jgi:hypothetical protein
MTIICFLHLFDSFEEIDIFLYSFSLLFHLIHFIPPHPTISPKGRGEKRHSLLYV